MVAKINIEDVSEEWVKNCLLNYNMPVRFTKSQIREIKESAIVLAPSAYQLRIAKLELYGALLQIPTNLRERADFIYTGDMACLDRIRATANALDSALSEKLGPPEGILNPEEDETTGEVYIAGLEVRKALVGLEAALQQESQGLDFMWQLVMKGKPYEKPKNSNPYLLQVCDGIAEAWERLGGDVDYKLKYKRFFNAIAIPVFKNKHITRIVNEGIAETTRDTHTRKWRNRKR